MMAEEYSILKNMSNKFVAGDRAAREVCGTATGVAFNEQDAHAGVLFGYLRKP